MHDVAAAEAQGESSSEGDSTGEDVSEVRQDSGDWVPSSWVSPDDQLKPDPGEAETPTDPRRGTPRRRRLPEIPKSKKRTLVRYWLAGVQSDR